MSKTQFEKEPSKVSRTVSETNMLANKWLIDVPLDIFVLSTTRTVIGLTNIYP